MISIEQQIKRRKVTMDLNEGKKIDLNEIDNSFPFKQWSSRNQKIIYRKKKKKKTYVEANTLRDNG